MGGTSACGLAIDNDRATLGPKFSASGPRRRHAPTQLGEQPLERLADWLLRDRSGVTPLPMCRCQSQSQSQSRAKQRRAAQSKYSLELHSIDHQCRCRLRLGSKSRCQSMLPPIRKEVGRKSRERDAGGAYRWQGRRGHNRRGARAGPAATITEGITATSVKQVEGIKGVGCRVPFTG